MERHPTKCRRHWLERGYCKCESELVLRSIEIHPLFYSWLLVCFMINTCGYVTWVSKQYHASHIIKYKYNSISSCCSYVILYSYYFEDVRFWLVGVISLWGKLLVLLLFMLFMFYLFMIVTIVCLCLCFMFTLDNGLPYWWRVVTTVIQFSTRGTVYSENW